MSRAAARDRSVNLSDAAIRAAIGRVEADDAGVRFSKEQLAAIHALGAGGKLSLLTGVAGSGKTTLLKPLVDAWRDEGRTVIGMSTAWLRPTPSRRPAPMRRSRSSRSLTRSTRESSRRTRTPSLSSTRSARSVPARC